MPDEERLRHMLDAASQIRVYITGINYDQFMQSRLHQDAVIRCFQVMGEAARRVSNDIRIDHPEIQWRDVIGLRTIVIHEYFRINLNQIWDTAQKDIPSLVAALTELVTPKD